MLKTAGDPVTLRFAWEFTASNGSSSYARRYDNGTFTEFNGQTNTSARVVCGLEDTVADGPRGADPATRPVNHMERRQPAQGDSEERSCN